MSDAKAPFRTEQSGDVAIITLDRPDSLNALNLVMLGGLAELYARLHGDTSVGAIVITGTGRAFCAGGDLRDLSSFGEAKGDGFRYGAGTFHQLVLAMRSCAKPTIAAIQGAAAGGGMSLALACDLRVMADHSFMQPGYLGRGLSPDGGLTHHLTRLVGPARAIELLLSDERIDAHRCLQLGLVSHVVPGEEVLHHSVTWAQRLANGPRLAMAHARELVYAASNRGLAEQLEHERVAIAECATAPEGSEGIDSFGERREPDFVAARRRAQS